MNAEGLREIPAPFASKEVLEKYKLVYRPIDIDENSPLFLQEKYAKALDLSKETKTINLSDLNEKSQSKRTKKKS